MASIAEIVRGDWPSRLLWTAQVCIGVVALLGLAMVITLNPYLLLGYAVAQALIIVGIILFIIVAVRRSAQWCWRNSSPVR